MNVLRLYWRQRQNALLGAQLAKQKDIQIPRVYGPHTRHLLSELNNPQTWPQVSSKASCNATVMTILYMTHGNETCHPTHQNEVKMVCGLYRRN